MTHRRLNALALLATMATGTVALAPGAHSQDATDTAKAYCTNLADEAEDARYANKLARITEAEAQVEARLSALEDKRQEYEDWLTRREKFLSLAQQNLVAIYSGMRPDAAALQLAAMDELTAAAVIAKVQARTASGILNEMDTKKAARIASIMSGLAKAEAERSAM